jgi:hypothetical protein
MKKERTSTIDQILDKAFEDWWENDFIPRKEFIQKTLNAIQKCKNSKISKKQRNIDNDCYTEELSTKSNR